MPTDAWRTLSEHLDHALELSDEERLEWLNKLRDREPALAAKLTELLEVRAQKGYSEFLSGPLRGEIELAQRQFTAAAADAQMAVDRAKLEAIDPKSSAWVGEALLLRARCELSLGDKAAAAASAREALAHVEQNLDPSHPLVAQAKTLSRGI
jgi:hypothetical protein